jgi:HAD superfamily hydrolase (TIGR01509 family)
LSAETPDPSSDGITHHFTAALFDFDETIVDLEEQHRAATTALCRELGAEYDDIPEAIRTASGTRILDELRMIREHFGWEPPVEELLARRQRHFDEICATADLQPMPGVVEVVRSLQQRLTLAVVSSAVRGSIEAILERLGLRDAFSLIVDGSEVQKGKPDPEIYLLAAQRLGRPPYECLVFEDSSVGVAAAKRAGMFCIGVRNARAQTHQDLGLADLEADGLDSLIPLLRR